MLRIRMRSVRRSETEGTRVTIRSDRYSGSWFRLCGQSAASDRIQGQRVIGSARVLLREPLLRKGFGEDPSRRECVRGGLDDGWRRPSRV